MSGLSDRLEVLSRTRNGPADVADAKEATNGGKGPHARVADNKWKRHSLAICERDREALSDGTKGDPDRDVMAAALGGGPRACARPPIPHSPSSVSIS